SVRPRTARERARAVCRPCGQLAPAHEPLEATGGRRRARRRATTTLARRRKTPPRRPPPHRRRTQATATAAAVRDRSDRSKCAVLGVASAAAADRTPSPRAAPSVRATRAPGRWARPDRRRGSAGRARVQLLPPRTLPGHDAG